MTNGNQLDFLRINRLKDEENIITSLYDLVDQFLRSALLLPPHQRNFVWQEEKQEKWIRRLREGRRPIGVIVTYQIKDNSGNNPIWINDGSQRLRTTVSYLKDPEKYGDSLEQAENSIRGCSMPVQHRIYSSHGDALIDFQEINEGTSLTPLEFHRGILTYMDGYDHKWKPLFDEMDEILLSNESKVIGRKSSKREAQHKYQRDNFALLYRFISCDKKSSDFPVGTAQLNEKDPIEAKLKDLILQNSSLFNSDKMKKFKGQIERDTASIEEAWGDRRQQIGIQVNLYRFLLHCGIYRYNNNIVIALWEEFLKKILDNTNGLNIVTGEGRDRKHISLGSLSRLPGICRILDSKFFNPEKSYREKSDGRIRAGYDRSHMDPFSVVGEGETISEPASRNRARGAKSITDT